MFREPWGCIPRRKRWRSPARAAASGTVFGAPLWHQCSASFGLSKSLSKFGTTVFPWPRAMSSSLKTGSETTYFSVAQLPRSRSRQRSLQKGKSAWTAESVSVLQIGHLCFMTLLFPSSANRPPLSFRAEQADFFFPFAPATGRLAKSRNLSSHLPEIQGFVGLNKSSE